MLAIYWCDLKDFWEVPSNFCEIKYGFKLIKFLEQYYSVYLKAVKVHEFMPGEYLTCFLPTEKKTHQYL